MRWLLAGLLSIIILYLGYRADLAGLIHHLATVRKEEKALALEAAATSYRVIAVEGEAARMGALKEMLNEWKNQLIKPANLRNLLTVILNTGRANHLQITCSSGTPRVKGELYVNVPVTVQATGSYEQLISFMRQVARMPWMVTIGDFSVQQLASADKTDLKTQAMAKLSLTIYYLAS